MSFGKIILLIFAASCPSHSIPVSVVPRVLLNDGNYIPAFGLGTWLGVDKNGDRVAPKGDEISKAVKYALDAGYRHIDTAKIYGIEDQVGIGIQNKIKDGTIKREDLFITTKLWSDSHAKDKVIPALNKSLGRLQLTYLDLYLIHWPISITENGSADNTDFVDTWRGMIEAKEAGLAKSIGVSNFNRDQLERLINQTGVTPAVLQVEINLNLQQPELLKYCKEKNIAVVAYTPFGSLFPSKAGVDAPLPRVDTPDLENIAKKFNKTTTQVVLRYLSQLGVIPIPKSITESRIESNINIFDFKLEQSDLDLLKSYDQGYRSLPLKKWETYPFYPFTEIRN